MHLSSLFVFIKHNLFEDKCTVLVMAWFVFHTMAPLDQLQVQGLFIYMKPHCSY